METNLWKLGMKLDSSYGIYRIYIMDYEYEDLKNTTWQVHGTMNIYLPTYLSIYLKWNI